MANLVKQMTSALKKKPVVEEAVTKKKKSADVYDIKTKKKVAEVEAPAIVNNQELFDYISRKLDKVERDFQLGSSSLVTADRLSSGVLVIDYLMGGGYAPGSMNSIAGKEQSGKSTLAMTAVANSLNYDYWLLLNQYNDPENSLDADYFNQVSKRPMGEIFGVRDEKGKYITPRRVRYYDEGEFEPVINGLRDAVSTMPIKRYNMTDGEWYFAFKRENTTQEMIKKMGLKVSNKFVDEGWYFCHTNRRGPEGLIVIDSYPSLFPTEFDQEGKEHNKSMALMARKFSEHLPPIRGRLRSRGIILIGVNQIRENPGAFGFDKTYEPGGNALKFASSMRMQINSIFAPEGLEKDPDNKSIEIEPSVTHEGEYDSYAWKSVKNTKNKHGTPFIKDHVRIWIRDGEGRPRGFDPVYDTVRYLQITGRITGSKKKGFKLAFQNIKRELTYQELKLDILTKNKMKLRERAFEELRTGEYKKFAMHSAPKGKAEKTKGKDLDGNDE